MGFPRDSVVKNQLTNAVGTKDEGLIPGLGRSTGEGNGNQYPCLGNPMVGCSPQGHKRVNWAQSSLNTRIVSLPSLIFGLDGKYGGIWSWILWEWDVARACDAWPVSGPSLSPRLSSLPLSAAGSEPLHAVLSGLRGAFGPRGRLCRRC